MHPWPIQEALFAPPPEGRLRQLMTSLGTIRELARSISVQCFHHDFFFIYFPLHLLSFVCPYVYIIFAMLLFFFVCLSIQERAKALEVVQYIKDTYHEGKCEVAAKHAFFFVLNR